MAGIAIDLTGQRFGRLRVIERTKNRGRGACWLCHCDCGVHVEVAAASLRRGAAVSCGCRRRETQNSTSRRVALRHGHGVKRHGAQSPTYRTWLSMKNRCGNPRSRSFSDYGGRGITVCERWRESFEAFLADMGERPAGTSLDRRDPNRGYEPGNCRWATPMEQAQAKRLARERVESVLKAYETEDPHMIARLRRDLLG